MRINVKCSTAIHILLMAATISDKCKLTSEFLSGSIGNNPVETRRLLSQLKKAGLIEVTRGTGGVRLLKEPRDISVLDVYNAVDASSLDDIIGIHAHPSEQCPFGRNINTILSEQYEDLSHTVKEKMDAMRLDQFIKRFTELEPELCKGKKI